MASCWMRCRRAADSARLARPAFEPSTGSLPQRRRKQQAMILYLHGFRSSPDSFKARMMADAMAAHGLMDAWACPQLPASPREAIDLALGMARGQLADTDSPRELTVIGSSLGGFYATWIAEQLGCKAVLLNPAVHAARDLATQVGEHHMYHSGAPFVFFARICGRTGGHPCTAHHAARPVFPGGGDRRRSAGLARDARPIRRLPPAYRARQRPRPIRFRAMDAGSA